MTDRDVTTLPPSGSAALASGGLASGGLVFGPGWDRQDRWLRFVDPVLESAYREAMTVPARRRFRIAGSIACLVCVTLPIQIVALFGDVVPISIAASFAAAVAIAAVVALAGRVGLRGIWALSAGVSAFVAIAIAVIWVAQDFVVPFLAFGLAGIFIWQIAVLRVAWWVAAGMFAGGTFLFAAVAAGSAVDGGTAAFQVMLLAIVLGGATLGSWFLESAERRAFSRGLLVDHLFRSYLSPDVAAALVEDPGRAELGGEVVEVSVLFADLSGYTPFAEGRSPDEVVAMLNAAFGAAVPAVFAEGGTIVSFVGDALMAMFNAPLRQPDHALRACRAALALQAATAAGPDAEGRPRFRVGIDTGPALVGNIGSPQLRNFSALGDTTNTAARLQTFAPQGRVVIGERTSELVRHAMELRPLGPVELKGKSAPTMVHELVGPRARTARLGPRAEGTRKRAGGAYPGGSSATPRSPQT
jgi:class 3 adenylate cyclase